MGKRPRSRGPCVHCHARPRSSNPYRLCSVCYSNKRCRSCGTFTAGKVMSKLCHDCTERLKAFRAAFGVDELPRAPNGTKALRIEAYAQRAALGLPLVGPIPVVAELHPADSADPSAEPRGVRLNGKGPRTPGKDS
jgi:hypothetical protein